MQEIYGLNQILHGDCLNIMKNIPDHSVDMIFCDLPYGITNCEWDKRIPLDELWLAYKRIIKKNGAVLLFAQQPFATDLISSNRKWFRYEWVWEKSRAVGVYNCNKMPLRCHELILVFYQRLPTYHPQFVEGKPYQKKGSCCMARVYRQRPPQMRNIDNPGIRYPRDVLRMNSVSGTTFHPTQKPLELLKYFILTYTNPGEIILDNCIGSGSTAVAAIETGRQFIGIEQEEEFVTIAKMRCEQAYENIGNL